MASDGPVDEQLSAGSAELEETVGTGTVIAIGCTILTIILTLLGVLIFMWQQSS